jgi:hypothetical protein
MKEFPPKFTPKNLKSFKAFKYNRDICYLREAIYECYLNEEEKKDPNGMDPFESPFDLDMFKKQRSPPQLDEMIKIITKELDALGWDVKVGHNQSSMWVYPKGKPPKSLPDW